MIHKLFFLLIAGSFVFTETGSEEMVTLKVEISGIRSQEGQLMVSIYDNREDFPDDKKMRKQIILEDIPGRSAEIIFDGLSSGLYAVAALHDENSDKKMNFNILGMPREGYCFSNNVYFKFRAPRWEEANFKLEFPGKTIKMAMHY